MSDTAHDVVRNRNDGRVLRALQVLVLGLPLLLGGRHAATVPLGGTAVLILLALTARERRRRDEWPDAPGLAALTAFIALALATTMPLPPALLRLFSPATVDLYARALPGWPGDGGWSLWRPLAIDPWGVWVEVARLSIGFGAFAVVIAYPWRAAAPGEDPRGRVLGQLLLTLIVGGVGLSLLALAQQVAGNGRVLWVTAAPAGSGRASGPFVNPNHFAAWLEMVMPAALAYVLVLAGRVRRRLVRAAGAGRGMGVPARRAWVGALVTHQRRLWAPLVATTALGVMAVAHLASGSRGGAGALLVGLGVAGGGIATRARAAGARRWLPALLGLGLVVASIGSVLLWAAAERDEQVHALETVDVSLGTRIAVAAEGWGVVRDHPVFGTGLGSWLHAFRPYQAPPVEGGIWDHAHNDYLELWAETGVAGAALALGFALAIARALRRRSAAAEARALDRPWRGGGPPGFEVSEWRAALGEVSSLRWGLAGGVTAVLVHSLVDFGLRMPANLLALMIVVGLLVVSVPVQAARRSRGLLILSLLVAAGLAAPLLNAALPLTGATPPSPRDMLERADLLLAEEGEPARERAVALVRRALDRSPADLEAHQALAAALGPGPAGDDALRAALALVPWSIEVRDRLGLRLLERGERGAGTAELEEAMFRFPYPEAHAYLAPTSDLRGLQAAQLIRALAEADTTAVRLAALDADVAAAIECGLTRALAATPAGERRAAIADGLITLLEARERWDDAAAALRAEGERGADSAGLARAARDYLKAHQHAAAEQMLLGALIRTPERGALYRDLAVEIYAARGDFPAADRVLEAGERNAFDMLPVYDGVTQVIARRELARAEELAAPAPDPTARFDRDSEPGEDQ